MDRGFVPQSDFSGPRRGQDGRVNLTLLLSLAGLALLAALAEVATMLPYLGALGLLAVRLAWPAGIEPVLARLNAWIARASGETLAWILGIAGFLIARDAAARLALVDLIRDW